MSSRKMIPIKELAEKLGIQEIDAYNLIILSDNKVSEIDNEWVAPSYAHDLAELTFNEYWSIGELEREVGISEGDLKYMCESCIQYDLPEYMKVRPISLCGTYFIHESYLETLPERFQSFNENAETIMYKIDMGLDDDDFLDISNDFGNGEIEEEQNSETPNTETNEDDNIIEEIIIIDEKDTDAEKQKKKRKKQQKEFARYRKEHKKELEKAVAARLRDEQNSKLKESFGLNAPVVNIPTTPNVPETHKPIHSTFNGEKVDDNKNQIRAKKSEELKQQQIKEDEYRKEQEKLAEERKKQHEEKIKNAVGSKYNNETETTGKYANGNLVDEYEKNRERLKKEQEKKQEELSEEIRKQQERQRKDEIARQEREKREQSKTHITTNNSHNPNYKTPDSPKTDYKTPDNKIPYTDKKPNESNLEPYNSDIRDNHQDYKQPEPKQENINNPYENKEFYNPIQTSSETPKSSVEGSRYDSEKYQEPKHEEHKIDTRNPYEVKQFEQQSENKYGYTPEDKKYDGSKPAYTEPNKTDAYTSTPTHRESYGSDKKDNYYKDTQPETPKVDTRNPYENKHFQTENRNDKSTAEKTAGGSVVNPNHTSHINKPSSYEERKKEGSSYGETYTQKAEEKSSYDHKDKTPSSHSSRIDRNEGARSDATRGAEPRHKEDKIDTRNPYEVKHSGQKSENRNKNTAVPINVVTGGGSVLNGNLQKETKLNGKYNERPILKVVSAKEAFKNQPVDTFRDYRFSTIQEQNDYYSGKAPENFIPFSRNNNQQSNRYSNNVNQTPFSNDKPPVDKGNKAPTICPVCHRVVCICGNNRNDNNTNNTTPHNRDVSYLDPDERKELLKKRNDGTAQNVADYMGSFVVSAMKSNDATRGIATGYEMMRMTSNVANMFLPNVNDKSKAEKQLIMQKSLVSGTSSTGVYVRMLQKRAEINTNKLNEHIEAFNKAQKDDSAKLSYVDNSLGLRVSTRDINFGSRDFQIALRKHNIDINNLTAENIKDMIKDNPKLANEFKNNVRLNEYLKRNRIDLNEMDNIEIALLMNTMRDNNLKKTLMERTGVVGFKDKLAIETYKKNGQYFITTREITLAKNNLTVLLAQRGIKVKGRDARRLSFLLKNTTDEKTKDLLEMYLGYQALEKGLSNRVNHRFAKGISSIFMSARSELARDDAFSGAYELISDIQTVKKIMVLHDRTLGVLIKSIKSKMGSAIKNTEFYKNTAKTIDETKKKAKEIVDELATPFVNKRKARLETLRQRRVKKYEFHRKRKIDFAKKHPKIAKTGKKLKGVGNKFGKVGKGIGKVFGTVGKFIGKAFNVFAKIKMYILLGFAIIFAVILILNALAFTVGYVGTTITNFFDNVWYDDIQDSEAFKALNTLEGYDKKLFNAINDVANSQDVSNVVGGPMYGFVNANNKSKYQIKQPGARYGYYGYEQHYYDSSGNEIARYSNAKDILCTSYAAFDGRISEWQGFWGDYKKYNGNLWIKTHLCTECGKQLTTENLILQDKVDIHCHPSLLYACSTGDCDGNGTPNTYTYYCNINAPNNYSTSAQRNTRWVYNTTLFKNNMNINAQTNTKDYLCVIYGDKNKRYSQTLYPVGDGLGCTKVYCPNENGSEKVVTIQGLTEDINGNKLSYKLPSTDAFLGFQHDCETYSVTKCSGCRTIKHNNNQLNLCNNKYTCDNKEEVKQVFEKVPLYDENGNDTGKVASAITLTYKNSLCDHTENITKTGTYQVTTTKGDVYYVKLTFTYTACAKHCSSHTVCPGHAKCKGHKTCNGHEMTYCTGHIDLFSTVTITSINDDKMFDYANQVAQKDSQKFEKQVDIDYARKLYGDDWADLYNIYFTNNAIPTPLSPYECDTLNPNGDTTLAYALKCVGIVPYHETYSKNYSYNKRNNFEIFKEKTDPDSLGRILKGLNEETFGSYILYNENYVNRYYRNVAEAIKNAKNLTPIEYNNLQPGDLVYDNVTGATGIIVSRISDANYKIIICSNEKSNVVVQKVSVLKKFTNYYSLTE